MSHKNNGLSPELERYLALCERTHKRMEAAGEWPWSDDWCAAPDSPEFQEMVESEGN